MPGHDKEDNFLKLITDYMTTLAAVSLKLKKTGCQCADCASDRAQAVIIATGCLFEEILHYLPDDEARGLVIGAVIQAFNSLQEPNEESSDEEIDIDSLQVPTQRNIRPN